MCGLSNSCWLQCLPGSWTECYCSKKDKKRERIIYACAVYVCVCLCMYIYVQHVRVCVCVLLRMRVGRWCLTMWRKFVVFSKPVSWNHRWRRRDAILRLSFSLLHICPYLHKFPSCAFVPFLPTRLFHFSLSLLSSRRTRAIFSSFFYEWDVLFTLWWSYFCLCWWCIRTVWPHTSSSVALLLPLIG